jgi:beta-1,4-mannosyltransferase
MEIFPFLLAVFYGALFVIAATYGIHSLSWLGNKVRAAIPTRYTPTEKPEDDHIQILVVGDIGRSPRMQYHGISAAKHGRKVDLIGYKGVCFLLIILHCLGHPRNGIGRLRTHKLLTRSFGLESARHPDLITNPNVALYALEPVPDWITWSTSLVLKWPLKALHQFWTLFHTLMYATPPAKWIIIQVSKRPQEER